jgi:hemerythrin
MDIVNWEDWLSLNIPSIDKEHKKLFGFIRELNEANKAKKDNEILGSILEGMTEYSEDHFKHEESLFVIHHYPEAITHKEAHNKYIEKVKEFKVLFKSGDAVLPTKY